MLYQNGTFLFLSIGIDISQVSVRLSYTACTVTYKCFSLAGFALTSLHFRGKSTALLDYCSYHVKHSLKQKLLWSSSFVWAFSTALIQFEKRMHTKLS